MAKRTNTHGSIARCKDAELTLDTGVRQDRPPFMSSILYELIVDTDEDDRRLDLLHQNVRKYGTVSNTVAAATRLEGKIARVGTA